MVSRMRSLQQHISKLTKTVGNLTIPSLSVGEDDTSLTHSSSLTFLFILH
jgi:hypothetical protein